MVTRVSRGRIVDVRRGTKSRERMDGAAHAVIQDSRCQIQDPSAQTRDSGHRTRDFEFRDSKLNKKAESQ